MDLQATRQVYALLAQATQICYAHGITHAVLCPGSRSAPLALSFIRNKNINHYILPDERSAAYTALGMAKSLQKPVALVCTSGTAALNFAPAVAEAFFSEVPLLVLTADRPPEWLGQADNQAIFQQHIYGKHVKQSYTFPVDLEHKDAQWFALRQLNETLNFSMQQPFGPVHINVPLREPLYLDEIPGSAAENAPVKITHFIQPEAFLADDIYAELSHYNKVVFVAGMGAVNVALQEILQKLPHHTNIVLLPDITANLHDAKNSFPFAELVLDAADTEMAEKLSPDLIISFGGPVVSKTIKQFLRKSTAAHWHLGFTPAVADTFQKLEKILPVTPEAFFRQLIYEKEVPFSNNYFELWQNQQNQVKTKLPVILQKLPYSEIKVAYTILWQLPQNSVLHLGNSLPIRYAAAFPNLPKNIAVYANRGTSGIDGSVSTAAGFSILQNNRTHTLLLGDLSFLYDGNGLWNNYLSPNLKIIVFNNHGGGIFRNLPGSAAQPELEEYFVVKQPLRVEHTALQYNCRYIYCNSEKYLQQSLDELYAENERPAVLELEFSEALKIAEVKAMLK